MEIMQEVWEIRFMRDMEIMQEVWGNSGSGETLEIMYVAWKRSGWCEAGWYLRVSLVAFVGASLWGWQSAMGAGDTVARMDRQTSGRDKVMRISQFGILEWILRQRAVKGPASLSSSDTRTALTRLPAHINISPS